MNKKYFSLVMNEETKEADINISGDITSWEWFESDVSNYTLSKQLEQMGDVKQINVHINSYGGEVAEGLAIYNALKNHKAKVNGSLSLTCPHHFILKFKVFSKLSCHP